MEEKTERYNNNLIVKILLLIGAIVVFGYFLLTQFIDTDTIFIGGPKYLMVEDHYIYLTINKKFSSLDLFFTEPVLLDTNNTIFAAKNGEEKQVVDNSKYKISSSSNNKVIRLSLKDRITMAAQ